MNPNKAFKAKTGTPIVCCNCGFAMVVHNDDWKYPKKVECSGCHMTIAWMSKKDYNKSM
jgi:hypothetical protein